ncbi:MAG: RNA methyltransferase [Bacteroidota bacterium]
MLSKARIKLINQLKQKKYRDVNKMFLAEGSINVSDFIKSGTNVVELFATDNWIQDNESSISDLYVTEVSSKDLKKISALSSPSQVLAILNLPHTPEEGQITQNNLTIALDSISDPGNLGTIIRTADWFGIKQIYCSNDTVDAYNPKVVQATMGSLARVEVSYTDLKTLFQNKPKDFPIFGAVLNGERITEIKPQKNGVILIGSEAHGISNELLQYITNKITIPSHDQSAQNKLESLNASIATAIILYALNG